MKKTLVAAILGVATVTAVNAQSFVKLDTYNSTPYYQAVTYGAGSGGALGTPIDASYTFGFYYGVGDTSGSIPSSGSGVPAGLTLATGSGATTGSVLGGYANSVASWQYDPVATGNTLLTIVVVAYNGADYASSTVRGHSAAFTYNATFVGSGPAPAMDGFGAFQVVGLEPIPEPSTFALAGLGLAGLLIFRRRK